MALARLALQNLGQRAALPYSSAYRSLVGKDVQKLRWLSTSAAAGEATEGKQVAASDEDQGGKISKLFPKKQRKGGLWRRNNREPAPALWEFFPSGLGNALMQATENVNKLFKQFGPSRLMGRLKEKDECYKLRYHMPGLGKEDVRIRVEDGVLTVKGEIKEEEEEGSDEELYYYGAYNTSVVLPPDAKADEIKAEMKDGVLLITIPRTEKQERDVKEVQVQ
ncbi:hypothetical protein RJ640_021260 [Escallonia rubra]|uniref:SHSP domain-containing protein n=1 Tax=Escallonia rubra TaxID=112253 RepID=A0AA88QP52_9ASTE|nr:hypothetical protein RJ640_021260 [Escallonia rubra]